MTELQGHHVALAGEGAYETRDAPPRRVAFAILCLFVMIAIAVAMAGGLFALMRRERPPEAATPIETAPLVPSEPRLEVDPAADRAALEAAARRRIDGYAWDDKAAGIARIPIGRAMELLAGTGWPDPSGTKGRSEP